MTHASKVRIEGKLNNSLVLNRYILSLFGANSLEALSEHLKDPSLEGWDENNISYFHHSLLERLFSNSELSEEKLLAYDSNIYRYTMAISEQRELPIKWKYFQYLSLLFTEIYLDKYFSDKQSLLTSINIYLLMQFNNDPMTYHGLSDLQESDLNKLAFWNATGSGKTLLMHMNILQYRHYADLHNKKVNRTLLITPNEGLTNQHNDEFKKSNVKANIFSKQGSIGLFAGHEIDILEITKLGDVDGDKTVAVDFFEGNNLVLVDEGHRGAGGDAWKERRDKLCSDGFSFEYSATFGQSISAISNATKRKNMLEEYGKSTIFDYSYRYFYNDGYGKDYQILNLNDSWNEQSLTMYLTACILNFYEQQRLYRDNQSSLSPFLVENPLAVFVGGSVTADKKIGDQEISDIVFILRFFQYLIDNKTDSIYNIRHLLQGSDGLVDKNNKSIFTRQFAYLQSLDMDAEGIYSDMLSIVFHCNISGAMLHLDNLKGKDGEIGMRIGNADYFGIINVGDSSSLAKKCEDAGIKVISKDYAEKSLFATINKANSKLNVLIGSKKFTEGWSSWRVSTMGLLNIGKSEGSQIIQLFGRGIRLKGYKFSLKRSSMLDSSLQPTSKPRLMRNLETLNIFGIKADYMEQFKQFLEDEGLPTNDSDYEEFELPVMPIVNLREKNLKYLKVKEGCDFKKDKIVTIEQGMLNNTPITLDYYPKIQALRSEGRKSILDVTASGDLHKAKLTDAHLAFIDWNKVFFAIVDYKNERSWYNLDLSLQALKDIAKDSSWYTLFIPEPQMLFTDFARQTALWQDILITLLKNYVEKAYNNQKSKWMSQHVEVAYLDTSHPNFEEEYRVIMHKEIAKNDDEAGFFKAINKLKEELTNSTFSKSIKIANSNDFEALNIAGHLYQPLLYLNDSAFKHQQLGKLIEVKPVALNKGERDFVCDIQRFYDNNSVFFKGKSLYLLRNKSRKGIGFFDDSGFYPDFIVWLIVGEKQYVSFVDPKGIRNLNGFSSSKIQLFKTIREDIEPGLHDDNIILNSFIVANSELKDVKHWVDFPELDLNSKAKEFNKYHIYFQGDQKDNYIGLILNDMLNSKNL